MTPDNVDAIVFPFLQAEFDKLGTKSKLTVENLHGGKPWLCVPHSLIKIPFFLKLTYFAVRTRIIGIMWLPRKPPRFVRLSKRPRVLK